MSLGYLVGDCLVAAAFNSYAGPFLSTYRDELVQSTWLKQVGGEMGGVIIDTYIGTKRVISEALQVIIHSIHCSGTE